MGFLRRSYLNKPIQWGPASAVSAAVTENAQRLGLDPKDITLAMIDWEGGGSTLHDYGPRGLHGTLSNLSHDYAGYIDYSNGYVDLGTVSIIPTDWRFAIITKCRLDSWNNSFPGLCRSRIATYPDNFELGFSDHADYSDIFIGARTGVNRKKTGNIGITTGTYYSLCAGADGTSFYIDVDGENRALSDAGNFAADTNNTSIGIEGTNPWDGRIDTFQVIASNITSDQCRAFTDQPYLLFNKIDRRYYSLPSTELPTLTADSGTYSLSGTDANLLSNKVLSSDPGIYAVNGADVGLLYNRFLSADPGTYSIAGTDNTFIFNRVLSSDAGTYTIDGTDSALLKNSVINADSGTYSIVGTDAGLIYTPVGIITLNADPGTYSINGADASLIYNRALSAEPSTYSITGTDATLIRQYLLTAGVGLYGMVGTDATLKANRILQATSGSYLITGTDTTLTYYSGALVDGVLTVTFTSVVPTIVFTTTTPTINFTVKG